MLIKGKTREDEDHAQRDTFIGYCHGIVSARDKLNNKYRKTDFTSKKEWGQIGVGLSWEVTGIEVEGWLVGKCVRWWGTLGGSNIGPRGLENFFRFFWNRGLSGCSGDFRGLMEAPCLRYPVISLVAGS
ncbi:hypothetical protein Glove_184g138 [Diversispora epigaea]|uniref:Uncharacterized protein n=1 Tax=Diversispora epigaea TaxID=1348612 RepID=A0A397IME7_9GLOM|nr:hypothetical protein Glove_184g138 [Diversispora epigaea]